MANEKHAASEVNATACTGRTDQILGAQVGSRDDGNSGFQFFIQMLFIAGGSAAQIPDRYKGKTDTQNGHHVHIPNQKSQHSPHSEQNQGQSFSSFRLFTFMV